MYLKTNISMTNIIIDLCCYYINKYKFPNVMLNIGPNLDVNISQNIFYHLIKMFVSRNNGIEVLQ